MVNQIYVHNSINIAAVCLREAIEVRVLTMHGPDPISDLWADSVHRLEQCSRVIGASVAECQQSDELPEVYADCPEIFN